MSDCSFTRIRESKRSWNALRAAHARLWLREQPWLSVIKQHADSCDRGIYLRNATILKRQVTSCSRMIFLDSLHSAFDDTCHRPLTKGKWATPSNTKVDSGHRNHIDSSTLMFFFSRGFSLDSLAKISTENIPFFALNVIKHTEV